MPRRLTLLVIDYNNSHNWFDILKDCRLRGRDGQEVEIAIDQCGWGDISGLVAGVDGVELTVEASADPIIWSPQKHPRTVRPSFVLVRNVVRAAHGTDYSNLLYGLKFGGIPCFNSIDSLLACQERATVYGELLRLRRRMGEEAFPLIPAVYVSNLTEVPVSPPTLPCVVKVGSAHAGYGKMLVKSATDFRDLRSTLALGKSYYTMEPFIADSMYDVRVQVLGEHMRAYRRVSDSWKGNMGNTRYEDLEVTDFYRNAATEAAKLFGGLDIFSLDFLHVETEEGETVEYILELNDSATGLHGSHADEDRLHIKQLVLARMQQLEDEGELPTAAGAAGDEREAGKEAEAEPAPPKRKPLPFLAALHRGAAAVAADDAARGGRGSGFGSAGDKEPWRTTEYWTSLFHLACADVKMSEAEMDAKVEAHVGDKWSLVEELVELGWKWTPATQEKYDGVYSETWYEQERRRALVELYEVKAPGSRKRSRRGDC